MEPGVRSKINEAPGASRLCASPLLVFLSFCLSLVLFQSGSAQTGTWMRQRVSSLAWLHGVYFLDEKRGWAVGSRGTLLATIDGGNSWQIKSQPTRDVLRDIIFTDQQNGWLVCEVNLYDLKTKDEPRTYLMETTDGGESWTRVELKGIDVNARLVRALFSRGRGWVFGEEGAIFTTRDSGATWTRLQSPTRYLLLGGTFVDADRGWLVGAGSTIMQTADGGETWHVSPVDSGRPTVRFGATSFVDNRLGWTVGSGGIIYRTVNGGRTWEPQTSGVTTDLFDVKFLDRLEGWAVEPKEQSFTQMMAA